MKRTFSILGMVFSSLAIAFWFVGDAFLTWNSYSLYGHYYYRMKTYEQAMQYLGGGERALSIVGYVCILTTLAMFIVICTKKARKLTIGFMWAPILALLTYAATLIMASDHYGVRIEWAAYVGLVLRVCILVFYLIGACAKNKQTANNSYIAYNPYVQPMNMVQNTFGQPQMNAAPVQDATEEIKKYKELLDSGIISQDEFDAKKKQLLNL